MSIQTTKDDSDASQGPAPIRILGLGGSMRRNSQSLAVLKAALALAEQAGAQTALADIRELNLPMYDPDLALDAYPETLTWLLEEARRADAFLLCSPTYHGTLTGSLKNALDALDFLAADQPAYFGGKLIGLIAVGGGGAHNVLNSLHHAARALNGLVAPTSVAVPHGAVDGETGKVTDVATVQRLQSMIDQVLDYAARLKR